MVVHFFERKPSESNISIEKLFSIIKSNLKNTIEFKVFKNPYGLSPLGMLQSMFFFKNNQGTINHITGDVHWAALLLKKNKTILTIHDIVGMETLVGIKKRLYFLLWFYLPAKRVKNIVAISHKTKNDLIRLLPWAERKIVVIPNCCTIESDFSDIKPLSAIPKFLIIGTRSNKNAANMLAALEGISCELHVVGELSIKQQNAIDAEVITFFNYINLSDEAIKQLYKKCDVLLFVSSFEGFGLPILEAQSQDCIVITSNIEPMLEVAGKGAVFADPLQVDSIKDAIQYILRDASLQATLIKNGRLNIERFTVESVSAQYLSLYRSIM
jgi:glycosyltransferase involved in cell wall biosynthesis